MSPLRNAAASPRWLLAAATVLTAAWFLTPTASGQDRLFLQPDGTVALDPYGRAVPYDPRTTWFGGATIWNLSGNAFARVVTAIRLWDEAFERETGGVTPGSPEALARAKGIVLRLAERQLAYLEGAEQRRAEYLEAKQAEWDEEHKPGMIERIGDWLSR